MDFINRIAPNHSRISCNDESFSNCSCGPDDGGGCRRCDLLKVAQEVTVTVTNEVKNKSKRKNKDGKD
jgi:hypothetical protein